MDDSVLFKLVAAVNTILDPTSSGPDRVTAHNICEECKEDKMCHLIGYALASNQGTDPQVKHFGLALMQHFVQTHWVHSDTNSQVQAKSNALSLLMNCGRKESCYVKDGIAHVVTDIAKHVWPQNWPTMVQDLISHAKFGPVQTELVELVFLRLAEDVAVLQNISVAHRSRDIRHGLSLSMSDIINFFTLVLQENSVKYEQLLGSTNAEEMAECNIHHTLSCNTLKALQGYVEWIKIDHLFTDDSTLPEMLCCLLSVDGVKVFAAECLLLIASRRGKPEERKLVLQLISPSYTTAMVSAIKKSLLGPQDEEEHYTFMKRMINVYSSLAGLIASSWGEDEGLIASLASHTMFLDVLVAFLQHENPVINYPLSSSWVTLLQHREIRKDETLQKYLPVVFETAAKRIQKDASSTIPTHARLDFNDEEEMLSFFKSYRSQFIQMVRLCARCRPIYCATTCLEWLSAALASPVDAGVDDKGAQRQQCTVASPSYIRWEALKTVLDMTFSCVVQSAEQIGETKLLPITQAKELFGLVMQYRVNDILLYQFILSTVSSFLPLLELMEGKSQLAVAVIHLYSKVLKLATDPSSMWDPPVKALRRQGLSSMVHLCKYHSALVMSVYEDFKTVTMELIALDPGLTLQDKVSIFEALILVSGEWNDFQKQNVLINEIMNSSASMWPAENETFFSSAADFAVAVGLIAPSSAYGNADSSSLRANISFCISLVLGVTYRSRVPEDGEVAKTGGFTDDSGFVVHPCSQAALLCLERIVKFVELFHSLWTPEIRSTVHPDYAKSLDMRDGEKTNLVLGNPQSAEADDGSEKQPWEKMQNFILLNLENCHQFLGIAGRCCGPRLYGSPNLIPSFIEKAFSNLQCLPELRMRAFIRQFLYYFLKFCPIANYESVSVPILTKFCEFLNEALQLKWNEYESQERARLNAAEATGNVHSDSDGDTRETVEIMNEQLLRTISREYLEMLVNLCIVKTPNSKKGDKQDSIDAESHKAENECQMQDISASTAPANTGQLTPLGAFLMDGSVAELLFVTALSSISWHDTATIFKAIQLLWPLLKHIFTVAPPMSDDAALSVFKAMLRGLRVHGQHSGCQAQLLALCLFAYMSLREGHPALAETLKSIPGASTKLVKDFDDNYKRYSEKKRKITFKKIVAGIIEHHVGQLFKTKQEMLRLPKILYRSRMPKREVSPEVDSVCALFGQNS